MSPPVVIYSGFSATVPAFSHTDDVIVHLQDDMYFSWLTARSHVTFTVVPWYTASLGAGAEGLYVNSGSVRQIPLTSTNIAAYINGGPAVQSFNQIVFLTEGDESLSFRVTNTTAADLDVTDLTVAAVLRPNSTGLPDYTADWVGTPPEVFSGTPISDYTNISDTLPNSGGAVSLIFPAEDHGGLGPTEAAVDAFPIPFPPPDLIVPYFTGIPNPFDGGFVGDIFFAWWDSDGAFIALSGGAHGTTGPAFVPPGGSVYYAAFAAVFEPVDGFGNIVTPAEVTLHLAMYLVHPINFSASATGAISFAGISSQFGARVQRATRSFVMVV